MEKNQLRLEIVAPNASDHPTPDGIRFFARRSFGASTWFVSLVLVLQTMAFAITMFVNNCPGSSPASACTVKSLGRFSFQPMQENPLLGPSASTLKRMGAIQRAPAVQKWRLLTFPWLNAGAIHLTLNFFSLLLFAIRLEQDYGPLRIAVIFLLSTPIGGLFSSIFVGDVPAVGSSCCLFTLLGTMLSGLIQNWDIYDDKRIALAVLAITAAVNFIVGLLPYVDNVANVGGFISGILLGFVFLFNPQLGQMERKKGLYGYNDEKRSIRLEQKLDRPMTRLISLVLYIAILAVGLTAFLYGTDMNQHCRWCRYINCLPFGMWRCSTRSRW